jgi:hypothetical protein
LPRTVRECADQRLNCAFPTLSVAFAKAAVFLGLVL